jgi:hypothetical protein
LIARSALFIHIRKHADGPNENTKDCSSNKQILPRIVCIAAAPESSRVADIGIALFWTTARRTEALFDVSTQVRPC